MSERPRKITDQLVWLKKSPRICRCTCFQLPPPLVVGQVPRLAGCFTDALTSVLRLSLALANIEKSDAGDASLQRYKESLGLGGGGKDLSDPSDPRVCIILSLTMEAPGRQPVTIDLSAPGSEKTLQRPPLQDQGRRKVHDAGHVQGPA